MYHTAARQLTSVQQQLSSHTTLHRTILVSSSSSTLSHFAVRPLTQLTHSSLRRQHRCATPHSSSSSSALMLPTTISFMHRYAMSRVRTFSSDSPQQQQSQKDANPQSSSSSSSTSAASASDSSDSLSDPPLTPSSTLWQRWTHESPMPERGTREWYTEMALIFTVFGITGSSSMYFVKPLVTQVLGLDGTMIDGPWSYRLACIGLLMPAYSVMLVSFGTLAGRHHFFKRQALRMWSRILPLHKLGIKAKPAPVAKSKAATTTNTSTTKP